MNSLLGSLKKIAFKSLKRIVKDKNQRLLGKDSILLVLDMQEKIINPIANKNLIIFNIKKIIDTCKILKYNVYVTEQYPEKLGKTIEFDTRYNLFSKRSFSCYKSSQLISEFRMKNIKKVMLCGVETHICILQSCLDLIDAGFEIHLLTDAIGSRNNIDHEMALIRMQEEGVKISTVEATIFQMCETSENVHFKEISGIVKRKLKFIE